MKSLMSSRPHGLVKVIVEVKGSQCVIKKLFQREDELCCCNRQDYLEYYTTVKVKLSVTRKPRLRD